MPRFTKKTNEPILRKLTERWKDGEKDGWMDGRMDRQTLFYRTLTAEGRGSKRKKVFSLINAGWIVSRILYIFFNINQINQLYLSNNEACCHHIYVNDTHGEKLCFTQSSTRIY